MKIFFPLCVAVVLGVLLFAAAPVQGREQPVPEQLPWSLRDHYTFSSGPLRLDYAVDNGEWRIKVYQEDGELTRMHPDVVVRDVGFSIELGDGRLLTHVDLGHGGETRLEREPSTSPLLGPGVTYTVHFAPREGLLVEHRLSTFKGWSFILAEITLRNQGETPVSVARINSAVIGPGGICGISENAAVAERKMTFRGMYPVFNTSGAVSKIRFQDTARPVGVALGVLPTGISRAMIDIQPGGGAWQGRIESAFQPPKHVNPGEIIQSDPIWVSFGAPPADVDVHYGWILQDLCKQATRENMPRAWVTVPDTEGIAALRRVAADARPAGILHALIPGNWEGRPGTQEGAAPRYPRNIADAARALLADGVTPGLTIDPLLGHGGGGTWSAQSVDGQSWINLQEPDGRAHAVNRIQRLLDMGFGFLTIEASRIPDEVLDTFGMTRVQADSYAFEVALEACGARPVSVLPTSGSQLSTNRNDWLEAAGAVSRPAEFGVAPAPVRLRLDGAASLDQEVITAMRLWRGTIEFLGAPPTAVQRVLADIFGKPILSGRPQDASNQVPLVWLTRISSPDLGYVGSTILSFNGAAVWDLADLEALANPDASRSLWRPEGDRALRIEDGRIVTTSQLTTHGLLMQSEQPVFAGVSSDITLDMDKLKRIYWDGERNVLSGQIDGPLRTPGHAFFVVPRHLKVNAARAGGKAVRPAVQGDFVILPVEANGLVFELEFSAN